MLIGQAAPVSGLAATATEVYVSDPGSNRIHVFSVTGLNELRNFPFTNPGKLTVDRAGNVCDRPDQQQQQRHPPLLQHGHSIRRQHHRRWNSDRVGDRQSGPAHGR